jgi:hypothetical protein
VTVDLDYPTLVDNAELTGVSSAAAAPPRGRHGHRRRRADPARPSPGRAVTDTVAGQLDDAAPTVAALTGSTWVQLHVELPGGLESARGPLGDGSGRPTTRTLTVSQPLSEFTEGSLSVTGTPGHPAPWWRSWVGAAAVAGALALVAAVALASRRTPSRR